MNSQSPVKILIVDNAAVARRRLRKQIQKLHPDDCQIFEADNQKEAMAALKKERGFDMVFLEVDMAGIDGVEFFNALRESYPDTLLGIVTKHVDPEQIAKQFKGLNLSFFIQKPWAPIHVLTTMDLAMKEINAIREAAELKNENDLRLSREVNLLSDIMIETAPKLHEHARRVSGLAVKIGDYLDLPDPAVNCLELAASLYLIGLINLPERDLTVNPRQLAGKSRSIHAKYHEVSGGMLKAIPELVKPCAIIMAHRENLDGSGPLGLTEETIPLEAKILRVCDHYNASVFLWGREVKETVIHMNRRAGEWFCKKCLHTLIKILTAEIGNVVIPVELADLKPGMKVAKNLRSQAGHLLLPEKTMVTDLTLKRLRIYNELDPVEEIFIFSEKL